MAKIVVTGAAGRIGGAVSRALQSAGHDVRGLVRSSEAVAGPRFEAVVGDLDGVAPRNAFADVDGLFLVTPDHPNMPAREGRIISAAANAGVRRIVKLSSALAGEAPPVAFGRPHAAVEQVLTALDVNWTVLRPFLLMESLAQMAPNLMQRGVLELPVRKAEIAFVALEDVAAAAVAVLTQDGHERKIYTLSGSSALDFRQITTTMSAALGRPIQFRSVPPLVARLALPWVSGMPRTVTEQLVDMMVALERGAQSRPTRDLPGLIGRAARSFEQVVLSPAFRNLFALEGSNTTRAAEPKATRRVSRPDGPRRRA